MNQITFSKMSGAGNDFVVVCTDDRPFLCTPEIAAGLCDRKAGIGSDGLILLSRSQTIDSDIPAVKMDFYNCDGTTAAICGNGLRCATLFAVERMSVPKGLILFHTGCGELHGELLDGNSVRINMLINRQFEDHTDILPGTHVFYGVSGVPHAVTRVLSGLADADIIPDALRIRHHAMFGTRGTNVDFVEFGDSFDQPMVVRTFETGVEGETQACGTGVCGTATVLHQFFGAPVDLTFRVRSGDLLRTHLIKDGDVVREVLLTGPAVEVYRGVIDTTQFIHSQL